MLLSKELENAINQQIGAEFAASLQYVSIAAYFDSDDLPQLAKLHPEDFVCCFSDSGIGFTFMGNNTNLAASLLRGLNEE